MKYADSKCTYVEHFKPRHVYVFTGPCVMTGHMQSVTVQAEELFAYRKGGLIQNALTSNTADEREFLLTGMSAEGWKQVCGEDDAD